MSIDQTYIRDAQVDLLEQAIEIVRPALQDLSERIVSKYAYLYGSHTLSECDYFEAHGTILVDGYGEKDTGRYTGVYCGSRLYLLTDGRLAIVCRIGTWDAGHGGWDRYEATMAIVTPKTALSLFDFFNVIRRLERSCKNQAAVSKSEAAQERVAKLGDLFRNLVALERRDALDELVDLSIAAGGYSEIP